MNDNFSKQCVLDRELLQDISAKTEHIYRALTGDEKLGVDGLVHRVDRLEKKERQMWFRATFIGGAVVGSCVGIKHFIEGIFTK